MFRKGWGSSKDGLAPQVTVQIYLDNPDWRVSLRLQNTKHGVHFTKRTIPVSVTGKVSAFQSGDLKPLRPPKRCVLSRHPPTTGYYYPGTRRAKHFKTAGPGLGIPKRLQDNVFGLRVHMFLPRPAHGVARHSASAVRGIAETADGSRPIRKTPLCFGGNFYQQPRTRSYLENLGTRVLG